MSQRRTAFITGITGQDGSYLAELLLARGYSVHGLVRNPTLDGVRWLEQLPADQSERLHFHHGNLAEGEAVEELVVRLAPREIYNLGAQSHVRRSFDSAATTLAANAQAVVHLLEAARRIQAGGVDVRYFQAASSEIYGFRQPGPWSESTAYEPRSPYGCAKVCAIHLVETYRQAHGLFACNGILFNHESPRRGDSFVTRKISQGAARIALGLQEELELGNIDVARDWGYAPEYVEAIWLMLQQEIAEDFVIATGQAHTLGEFLEIAFAHVGLAWQSHVRVVSSLKRTRDAVRVVGDAANIRRRLGWRPEVSFEELVRLMVDNDIELARAESAALARSAA